MTDVLTDHPHLVSSVTPTRTDVACTSQQKDGVWSPSYLTFSIDQTSLFKESPCQVMWLVDGYAYAKETLLEMPLSMSPVWICQDMISTNDHQISAMDDPVLFPNPSFGHIFLQPGVGPCTYRLWNSFGQLVQSGKMDQELFLGHSHPGVYQVDLTLADGRIIHQQIVLLD